MDFSNFKEEFINICKNGHNTFVNSSAFYFVKEKYDHLSSLHRKILHTVSLLVLVCIVFYYPFSYLYFSWINMRNFYTKKELTRELIDLSSITQPDFSKSYTSSQEPVRFIEQKIPTLQIPKSQIKEIKKSNSNQQPKNFPLSSKVEAVEVEIKNLNLKEIVQYGHKLEQLSDNIKLTNIYITENPKKNNYFNVSYILSFFSLITDSLPNKKIKTKSIKEPVSSSASKSTPSINDKNFDNLKIKKNPPLPPLPPSSLSPSPEFLPVKQPKKNDSQVPLLDLKKEDITDGDSHFKARPNVVKKRDLLPALPVPQNKKDKPSFLNIPPPPPLPQPTQPDVKNKTQEKE